MMSDDEIIAVVQAHKEGKQIQFKNERCDWTDCANNQPAWEFNNAEYRVAPEPPKPREWWAEFPANGGVGQIFTDPRQLTKGGKLVHVREIIE